MKVSQQQVVFALLGLMSALTGLIFVVGLFTAMDLMSMVSVLAALVVLLGLLAAYWRGFQYTRHLTLIFITCIIALTTSEPFLSEQFTLAVLLPPVLAIILAGPAWVVGSAAGVILLLLARAGWQGAYAAPLNLILYAMIVGGLILSRLVTDTAQREAEEQAARAETALKSSELQTAELAQKADELARQNDEQRRLIDLVAVLETPAVALAEGVLLAPVVGHLDSRRATVLTDKLLREVSESRASLVILDIAGVPAVDTGVAQSLLRAVQAVRLLGCQVTITGISASIAATLTQLGISLAGVQIARTPQEALAQSVQVATNGARRN